MGARHGKTGCAKGLAYVPQAPPWLKVGARARTKTGAHEGVISAVKILNVGRLPGGHVHMMEITWRTSDGEYYCLISEGKDGSGQLEPLWFFCL